LADEPSRTEDSASESGKRPRRLARVIPGFGAMRFEAWESIARGRDERRHRMATQSWPEYLRGLAMETGVILAVVAAVALVLWVLRLIW